MGDTFSAAALTRQARKRADEMEADLIGTREVMRDTYLLVLRQRDDAIMEAERLRALLIDPSVEDMERLRTAFDEGHNAGGIRGGIRAVLAAVLRTRAEVTRG